MEPGDEVHDDQHQKHEVNGCAGPTHGAQEAGIEALDKQSASDDSQDEKSQRRNGDNEQQRRIVDSENRSEEDMHGIDVAAVCGDNEHPKRQLDEIEGGKAGILALRCHSRDETGQDRHD